MSVNMTGDGGDGGASAPPSQPAATGAKVLAPTRSRPARELQDVVGAIVEVTTRKAVHCDLEAGLVDHRATPEESGDWELRPILRLNRRVQKDGYEYI